MNDTLEPFKCGQDGNDKGIHMLSFSLRKKSPNVPTVLQIILHTFRGLGL